MSNNIKTSIWIDLEDTVIDNWSSGYLLHLNVEKIKTFLNEKKPHRINIWSFAIWYEKQKLDFINSGMKESIECALESLIDQYPSIEEMRALVYDFEHIHYQDTNDFILLNGKAWSFIKFASLFSDTEFFLIDDSVPSLTVQNRQTNTIIHLLNIERDL